VLLLLPLVYGAVDVRDLEKLMSKKIVLPAKALKRINGVITVINAMELVIFMKKLIAPTAKGKVKSPNPYHSRSLKKDNTLLWRMLAIRHFLLTQMMIEL
jgi:hypothetical protein